MRDSGKATGPTEATVAHVLVSKFADHLPLYRQAQILERSGVHVSRATLAYWMIDLAMLSRSLAMACAVIATIGICLSSGLAPRRRATSAFCRDWPSG